MATQISTKYLKNLIIIFCLEIWYSSTSRDRYGCPIRIFSFDTDQAQIYSLFTQITLLQILHKTEVYASRCQVMQHPEFLQTSSLHVSLVYGRQINN